MFQGVGLWSTKQLWSSLESRFKRIDGSQDPEALEGLLCSMMKRGKSQNWYLWDFQLPDCMCLKACLFYCEFSSICSPLKVRERNLDDQTHFCRRWLPPFSWIQAGHRVRIGMESPVSTRKITGVPSLGQDPFNAWHHFRCTKACPALSRLETWLESDFNLNFWARRAVMCLQGFCRQKSAWHHFE